MPGECFLFFVQELRLILLTLLFHDSSTLFRSDKYLNTAVESRSDTMNGQCVIEPDLIDQHDTHVPSAILKSTNTV